MRKSRSLCGTGSFSFREKAIQQKQGTLPKAILLVRQITANQTEKADRLTQQGNDTT